MTAVDVRCPDGCGEHFTVDLATSEVAVGRRLLDALVVHRVFDCAELSPLLGDPADRAAPASAPDEGEPAGCPAAPAGSPSPKPGT